MKSIFALLCSSIISFALAGQNTKSGILEMDIMGYSLEEGGPVDSLTMNTIIEQLKSKVSQKIIYTEDKVVLIQW